MSKLTGTHSEVSEIDFTTLTTVPGTVKVHGAPIQILDLRTLHLCQQIQYIDNSIPAGIIEGANDGRGRGRQGMETDMSPLSKLNSIPWNLTVIAGMDAQPLQRKPHKTK